MLSKKQLRDIQDIAEILFNLENEVGLSEFKDNPVFEMLDNDTDNIYDLIKNLFMRDDSLRLSNDIFKELSKIGNERIAWRQTQGAIMQDICNNKWLLRNVIHRYALRHYSKKHHEISIINDIVYLQFLNNCYKNRGVMYRIRLFLAAKQNKVIERFEEHFDYRDL